MARAFWKSQSTQEKSFVNPSAPLTWFYFAVSCSSIPEGTEINFSMLSDILSYKLCNAESIARVLSITTVSDYENFGLDP